MKHRSIVAVLVMVASVLMAPIAMAYAGYPMMGTVCFGPCGVPCAAASPMASLPPVPSAVASTVPEVHHHRNVFAAFEPPPKLPFRSA